MPQYPETIAYEQRELPPADVPTAEPPVNEVTPESSWLDAEVEVSIATYQAYQILYYAFTAMMAIVGLDKFLHLLGTWEQYVSPGMASFLHMSPATLTALAGLIELGVATSIALKPRIGSWVLTSWLWLITLNLLTMSGHLDLLVITLGLSAVGLAFTRLAAECN